MVTLGAVYLYFKWWRKRKPKVPTPIPLAQLTRARAVILANAEDLVKDALLLLNAKRFARSYALSVLAREEMAKLAIVIRSAYALKAGEPVDWQRFHRRLADHTEKLKLSALVWLLLSTSMADKSDPKSELIRLLQNPEKRKKLNEGKQDGFYVGISANGIKDPRAAISEQTAQDLYLETRTLLEFFSSGEDTDPEKSVFAGIQDLYGKHVCLADDLVEVPDSVVLPR
ncbi:MAG: AbiV family abortive infection protein [Pyrinomonadaceae bacterium]